MGARALSCLFVCLLVASSAGTVQAQYFGHNKVRYEDLEFRLLRTDHFDIYFSESDGDAARRAGRLAERWYVRLSGLLQHQLSTRQSIVLYGSHPDFEQTNVISGFLGEEIGGVTESRRRRIVMPFGLGLAESDHVLGHELVHAFQYDIAETEGRSLAGVPLWFAEGMAEYLSSGPVDPVAAMMIRDTAHQGKLPAIQTLASFRLSPYKTGQALWAWLGGRFGDDIVSKILKARPRNVIKRIEAVTGVSAAELTRDWQADITASAGLTPTDRTGTPIVSAERSGGRLNIAPSLSPDGRHLVFLSERDRLSVDVFLADAVSGAVRKKLLTTAANPELDSLQFLSSAGAWSPDGHRLLLATVRHSRPVLALFHVATGRREREIVVDSLDQVFHPSWSPDGRMVAFTGLKQGQSDLYQYDLDKSQLTALTNDAFTDFQPVWSPDGRQLAFATDRFTTTLADLRFGPYKLALLDTAALTITPVAGLPAQATVDPQWAPDGRSLYFRAAPAGISNVMQVDLASGSCFQITDVTTGVVGVTSLSPSLSVATANGRIAFTVYRNGGYEIRTRDRVAEPETALATVQPHVGMLPGAKAGDVSNALADAEAGLPADVPLPVQPYAANMGLDAIGQPYFAMSAGGNGGLLRGGTSFFFGDLLGDRYLGAAVQAGASLEDLALDAQYLNRSSRWTWGGTIALTPFVRGYERRLLSMTTETPTLVRETERHRQFHLSLGGLAAYPFNRSTRVEIQAGARNIWYQREVRSRTFGIPRGALLSDRRVEIPAPATVTLFETSVAFVRDTAVRGPVSPILGTRTRFEIASSVGAIPFVQALADYRRYWVPVRPYTVAVRALHIGRYGRGSDDPRLVPLYLGRPGLVRGYHYSTARSACEISTDNDCGALNALLGSRLLVGQLEVRVPLLGALSGQFDWRGLPIEALLFGDAGTAWDAGERPGWFGSSRPLFASVGAGVRVNPAGFVMEFDVARRLSTHAGGWTFLFNVRPGF